MFYESVASTSMKPRILYNKNYFEFLDSLVKLITQFVLQSAMLAGISISIRYQGTEAIIMAVPESLLHTASS